MLQRRKEKTMSDKKKNAHPMLGAGIAIGLGTGVAIGVAMDNVGLGIAIGLPIGVAIGMGMSGQKKNDDSEGDT